MPSISLPVALGVGSVASAVIGGSAASSAAKTQANAATNAADIQHQQYLQTRSDLLPYNAAGQAATTAIQNTPAFNFAPTQAQIEATPGYEFSLSQGLKATQNGAAARGLGVSGAALKGAATYSSGLADTTYQNQFANALSTYQTNLSKQQNLASLGENAGAQTGNIGATLAGNEGQALVGAANASAAGQVGTANALAGGINGLSNAFLTNQFLNNPSAGGGIFGSSGMVGGQVDPALFGAT